MASSEPGDILDRDDSPPQPLAFVAGSWNRFEILDALREGPRTREELRGQTGVSRPTLSRIVSDLVEKDWIVRHNDQFSMTSRGRVVVTEVERLTENLETAEQLDGALDWLPYEQFGFDLGALSEAKILTPQMEDQTGPMRELAEFIGSQEELRIVATGVTYEVVDAICEACLAGELRLRCVLGDQGLEGLRSHSDLAGAFREMVARGHCEAFHYDGDDQLVDCNLLEDRVMICGHSDDGRPAGILISEEPAVISWTSYYFETLRQDARALAPVAFTG